MKTNKDILLKYCLRAEDTTKGRSRVPTVVFFCPGGFYFYYHG